MKKILFLIIASLLVTLSTTAQTLTITAGAYDDGLQTINLSVKDADQVIIQEKEIVYWGYEGYECWSTVNVTESASPLIVAV